MSSDFSVQICTTNDTGVPVCPERPKSRDTLESSFANPREAAPVDGGTRSSRDFIEVVPESRSSDRIVPKEVYETVERKLLTLMGHEPRLAQVEAIIQLVFGKQDVLLQAATGYGKSAIWKFTGHLTATLTKKQAMTVMVSPLNSLTKQQIDDVNQQSSLTGAKAVAVTAQNNDDKLYRAIARGEFTNGKLYDCYEQPLLFRTITFSRIHDLLKWYALVDLIGWCCGRRNFVNLVSDCF